ncbi:unnamed protein product [Penicillium nalgiovense]|nr:unnamed protein product [Penicillium nalgiovense]
MQISISERDTEEPWEVLLYRKQLEDAAKIPTEWRIPEELTDLSETSGTSVLDVPRQSEILSARQPEITEKYDATDLLGKIHRQELSAHEVTNHFAFGLPLHNMWYELTMSYKAWPPAYDELTDSMPH